ncbi:orotidine-5'-phosphate decarboxylase [Rhodopila sp.]|uniref:orotidine-5'-phosphate decarboxylase n=1 Tax=Rhodopila sp. TaxID=2480087 RepID=UPI003D0D94BA
MEAASRLIVALDTVDVGRARAWADVISPHAGLLKIGLEFFLANGAPGFGTISGAPVFLDLKLHDIPNTVAGAVLAVLPLKPRMLTIHAGGGPAMIRAAHQAAASAGDDRPMILAVTVLTSLDQDDLVAVGVAGPVVEQVLRLGRLAVDCGADGLVCSPLEVAPLRQALGPSVKLIVPGIRPAGSSADDQGRTMTPAGAISAGADWIVVGRPITGASDPGLAAANIAAGIR